jgi:hypothetical protein
MSALLPKADIPREAHASFTMLAAAKKRAAALLGTWRPFALYRP